MRFYQSGRFSSIKILQLPKFTVFGIEIPRSTRLSQAYLHKIEFPSDYQLFETAFTHATSNNKLPWPEDWQKPAAGQVNALFR
jgi:hypothetical protein